MGCTNSLSHVHAKEPVKIASVEILDNKQEKETSPPKPIIVTVHNPTAPAPNQSPLKRSKSPTKRLNSLEKPKNITKKEITYFEISTKETGDTKTCRKQQLVKLEWNLTKDETRQLFAQYGACVGLYNS